MSEEILDQKVFGELRGLEAGEKGFLTQIVEVFLSDAAGRIPDLTRAALDADFEKLASGSHAFKGSCLTIGAAGLAAVCRRLERCAKAGDLDELPRLLGSLQHEFDRTKKALQKEVEQ